MMVKTNGIPDDPFRFALELTHNGNITLSRYINNIINAGNHKTDDMLRLHDRIQESNRTKFMTFREINPDLRVHDVYALNNRHFIPEHYRIAFTRLRLSSHNLKIETGRWSRLPRERRLCPCGLVQDEKHAIELCALTLNLRTQYARPAQYPDILRNAKWLIDFKYLHDVLTAYQ